MITNSDKNTKESMKKTCFKSSSASSQSETNGTNDLNAYYILTCRIVLQYLLDSMVAVFKNHRHHSNGKHGLRLLQEVKNL